MVKEHLIDPIPNNEYDLNAIVDRKWDIYRSIPNIILNIPEFKYESIINFSDSYLNSKLNVIIPDEGREFVLGTKEYKSYLNEYFNSKDINIIRLGACFKLRNIFSHYLAYYYHDNKCTRKSFEYCLDVFEDSLVYLTNSI